MHLTSKHVVPSHFCVTPGGFACWSIGGFIPSSTDCGDELGVKSLTAIDGHDRQYFNELRVRMVSP